MPRARIPPPIYAFLSAVAMWLLARYVSLPWLAGPFWIRIGYALIVLGCCLDASAVILFIRNRTTINPMRLERTQRLVVTGLNRFSRNPMYLGMVLILAGWVLLLGNPFNFALLWIFVRLLEILQIRPEEKALLERFGDTYLRYSKSVNRWVGRR